MGRECRLAEARLSNPKAGMMKVFYDFLLIPSVRIPSQWPATMGQQSKKIIKRRRRADYLKRKAETAKLGGLVKKPASKKADVAKKAPAKKVAAKKAPAKKVAKKSPELEEAQVAAAAPESTEPESAAAVEHVAEKTVEAIEENEAAAPQADEEA